MTTNWALKTDLSEIPHAPFHFDPAAVFTAITLENMDTVYLEMGMWLKIHKRACWHNSSLSEGCDHKQIENSHCWHQGPSTHTLQHRAGAYAEFIKV